MLKYLFSINMKSVCKAHIFFDNDNTFKCIAEYSSYDRFFEYCMLYDDVKRIDHFYFELPLELKKYKNTTPQNIMTLQLLKEI